MPKSAPKPCTYPRCNKYATRGARCGEHQPKHNWKHTQNRHERGYGTQWYKIRARVLTKFDHICQSCLRDGIYTRATQVDHIIPKFEGGTDEESNLEPICDKCHKIKTRKESQRAKQCLGQTLKHDEK